MNLELPAQRLIARKVLVQLELLGQRWEVFGPGDAQRISVAIAFSIGLFAHRLRAG